MGKRRRERDRPKAAHDAAYNPNKRVLLSYGSDDEEVEENEEPIGTGRPDALEAVVDNYQIEEYGDEDEEEEQKPSAPPLEASSAQLSEESIQGDDVEGDAELKKSKPQSSRGPRRNNATGQIPALGSLSYQWEDELEADEENDTNEDSTGTDAMAYLRQVRSQRQSLPSVLTAQPEYKDDEEEYNEDEEDSRGYFDDGAYVASAYLGPMLTEEMKVTIDAQDAFTRSLKARFKNHRSRMRCGLKESGEAKASERDLVTFPTRTNKERAQLIRTLAHKTPSLSQVLRLDQRAALGLLELVQQHHLGRERIITKSTSIWIWSLLAFLDDVGTMNNDTVSVLREFAKTAILVQLSFHDPVAARLLELGQSADGDITSDSLQCKETANEASAKGEGSSVHSGPSGSAEESSAAIRPSVVPRQNDKARENTLATLDAIIVVVGELYGQRDLLEFRQPWSVEEHDEEACLS